MPFFSPLLNRVGAQLPLTRCGRAGRLTSWHAPTQETLPEQMPSVSVICPCRNEKGNIMEAVLRTPVMGPKTELIFVDGNSTDGTVEEIEKIIAEYEGPLDLRLILQGDGKGKGDAVRKGYAAAKNDVLMILDSDLTVPQKIFPSSTKRW